MVQKELKSLIEEVYGKSGLPSILYDDYGSLWGMTDVAHAESFFEKFCDSFGIPCVERPDLSEARDFVASVTVMAFRYHAIVIRRLQFGVSVVYDSLPLVKDVYTIGRITDDYMIELTNKQLCHPLWLRRNV